MEEASTFLLLLFSFFGTIVVYYGRHSALKNAIWREILEFHSRFLSRNFTPVIDIRTWLWLHPLTWTKNASTSFSVWTQPNNDLSFNDHRLEIMVDWFILQVAKMFQCICKVYFLHLNKNLSTVLTFYSSFVNAITCLEKTCHWLSKPGLNSTSFDVVTERQVPTPSSISWICLVSFLLILFE